MTEVSESASTTAGIIQKLCNFSGSCRSLFLFGTWLDDRPVGGDAAVDGDNRACDVARARRGEKSHEVGDLLGGAHAPAGIVNQILLPAPFIAEMVACPMLHHAHHAIGRNGTGIDP